MKKWLSRLAIIMVVSYLAVLGHIATAQRSLMYHPRSDEKQLAEYNLHDTTESFITTSDGLKLQVWHHPPEINGKMVIFFHGNAGNIGQRVEKLRILGELGYGYIIAAWRGFGESQGSPSKEGIYTDARTVIEYAKSLGYHTEDIILVGESLGSGIATKMATEQKFKGLFLITPYTTINDRAQEIYFYLPVKYLLKDNFNNVDEIKNVKIPVIIIHGDDDDIIPHHHGEKVFSAASDPKKFILYPGVKHADYDDRIVFEEMDKFFQRFGNGEVTE